MARVKQRARERESRRKEQSLRRAEKRKRKREWEEREGRIGTIHRSSALVKVAVLACVSLLSVGSYFAYDSIAALETYVKKAPYRLSSANALS